MVLCQAWLPRPLGSLERKSALVLTLLWAGKGPPHWACPTVGGMGPEWRWGAPPLLLDTAEPPTCLLCAAGRPVQDLLGDVRPSCVPFSAKPLTAPSPNGATCDAPALGVNPPPDLHLLHLLAGSQFFSPINLGGCFWFRRLGVCCWRGGVRSFAVWDHLAAALHLMSPAGRHVTKWAPIQPPYPYQVLNSGEFSMGFAFTMGLPTYDLYPFSPIPYSRYGGPTLCHMCPPELPPRPSPPSKARWPQHQSPLPPIRLCTSKQSGFSTGLTAAGQPAAALARAY